MAAPPRAGGTAEIVRSMPTTIDQPQAATAPAATPAQASSLLIQPASITSLRLSLVIGLGARRMALTSTPLAPPLNLETPEIEAGSAPSAIATAASAATLPS